jgi:cytochrome c-type biogenesis protein CcmH/NrfG
MLIKGVQALLRRDGSSAVEAFTNASRKFPRNDDIFLWLGRGYGMLRDDDRARQNYERAVELNPRNAEAWTYLGATLNKKEPSKAVEACKKATELQPANANGWFILGLVYMSQGKSSLAVPFLERAVHIKPDFTEAWSTLAGAYSMTGDYKRSSDARQRAEDLKARNTGESLKHNAQPMPSQNP